MKLVDINVLLYSVNKDTTHHKIARLCWENLLSGEETTGLSWIVILGFIRIITNGRIMTNPLDVDRALALVDEWLQQPNVQIVSPSNRHWAILHQLLSDLGSAANLTTDAHIAALAIENGASLYSFDSDFSRFNNLKWINPII